jgi:hypothetical protein
MGMPFSAVSPELVDFGNKFKAETDLALGCTHCTRASHVVPGAHCSNPACGVTVGFRIKPDFEHQRTSGTLAKQLEMQMANPESTLRAGEAGKMLCEGSFQYWAVEAGTADSAVPWAVDSTIAAWQKLTSQATQGLRGSVQGMNELVGAIHEMSDLVPKVHGDIKKFFEGQVEATNKLQALAGLPEGPPPQTTMPPLPQIPMAGMAPAPPPSPKMPPAALSPASGPIASSPAVVIPASPASAL